MEKIRAVVIEDTPDWRTTIIDVLEDLGCEVVDSAKDLETARKVIGTFGDRGVQLVTLDGDLSDKGDARDGNELAAGIRKEYPDIYLFGFFGRREYSIQGVDSGRLKSESLFDGLEEAIRILRNRE